MAEQSVPIDVVVMLVHSMQRIWHIETLRKTKHKLCDGLCCCVIRGWCFLMK